MARKKRVSSLRQSRTCSREESHNRDDREYPNGADPVREVLIHGHYLSQKAIEICAAFDLTSREDPKMHVNFPGIESLHQTLRSTYTEREAATDV